MTFDQRPELQEGPLRDLAHARGWDVVEVYTDRASGSKESRPALDRMMSDARRRRFDVLMVWRFDRLSRSTRHFLSVIDELRGLGVEFISHEQTFDTTTPMGKFALTLFAALAELERHVICERIAAGLRYAREHGTKSARPIGRPRVVVDALQIAELRQAGMSWRAIARELRLGDGTIRRAYAAFIARSGTRQNLKENDL